jgi:hypothetical protein
MSLHGVSNACDLSGHLSSPYSVVEHFILLLQTGHESILSEVIRTRAVLGVCALHLFVERLDVGGEQAMELEGIAFFLIEGRAFIKVGSS